MFIDPLGLAQVNFVDYIRARGGTVTNLDSRDGRDRVAVTVNGVTSNWFLNNGYTQDYIINERFGWGSFLSNSDRNAGTRIAIMSGRLYRLPINSTIHEQTIIASAAGGDFRIRTNIVYTRTILNNRQVITLNSVSHNVDHRSRHIRIQDVEWVYGVGHHDVRIGSGSPTFNSSYSWSSRFPFIYDTKKDDFTTVGLSVTYNFTNRGNRGTLTIENRVYAQRYFIDGVLFQAVDPKDVLLNALKRSGRY